VRRSFAGACALFLSAASIAQQPVDLSRLPDPKDFKAMRSSSNHPDKESNDDSKRPIPGETITLAELTGPGVVTHIWLTVAANEYGWPRLLRLRIYYDGSAVPSVDAPVGDFFAVGHGFERPVESLVIRASSEGRSRNSYWPMPFRKSCRITVTNEGRRRVSNLYYHVDWKKVPALPADTGYFHARYRQALPNSAARPYEVLSVRGRGHYVGTVYSIVQAEAGWFGEGDDYISVDGEKIPSIEGTGKRACGARRSTADSRRDLLAHSLRELRRVLDGEPLRRDGRQHRDRRRGLRERERAFRQRLGRTRNRERHDIDAGLDREPEGARAKLSDRSIRAARALREDDDRELPIEAIAHLRHRPACALLVPAIQLDVSRDPHHPAEQRNVQDRLLRQPLHLPWNHCDEERVSVGLVVRDEHVGPAIVGVNVVDDAEVPERVQAYRDRGDAVKEPADPVPVGIGAVRRQPIDGDERRPEDDEKDAGAPESERQGRR
jgi:hypothetical protein